ncbi:RHS repeat-associated core domain-containing protein [Sphingomonas sp.]|uniref:RHS repeat domain-containing protein n=1 Tax=Sphingomonas sp. TaxID=28214 RepID=UPI001B02C053|nr:RHS repeat-associated core domain-containing protein [Sphingomonas sp.]MBO9712640.1 RHS repeat-associated core domain-containing protein [Sphingomonas sp.]
MMKKHSGRARGRIGRRIALSITTILASGLVAPAMAQTYRNLDANGVDLTLGDFVMAFPEGAIGSGPGELALVRRDTSNNPTQWDKILFTRTGSGTSTVVTIRREGGYVDKFTNVGLVNAKGNGATLTMTDNAHYTYQTADGTTITFLDPTGGDGDPAVTFCGAALATNCTLLPDTITSPNGRSITLSWDIYPLVGGAFDWRLASVANSYGYSVTFTYADNSYTGSTPAADWFKRTQADFRNTAIGSTIQGSVTYAYPSSGTVDVTDMAGATWRVTATSIRRPGEGSASFTVGGTTNAVTSVTRDGITTSYSRSVSGTTATMTVTDAQSHSTVIVSNLTTGRPTSVTDATSKTTGYSYDSYGRLTRVTAPEGNYINYTYDGRGNITETRRVAKSGSGLSDIVETASYPSTCSNPVTCNEPTSTTDARSKTTDYTYDSTHGGVTAVTGPAPSGSGTRPETRYSYTLTNGEYLVTGVSACRTSAAPGCVGTSDETKTTVAYDTNGNVTSLTQAAGDNSLSAVTAATYTPLGDVLTVDGPLSGNGDTTTFRYDAARRQTGAISADPDGGGSLKRRAQKTTYDSVGRATDVEIGTVNGTSDSDWSAFVSAQKVTTSWSGGYKTKDVLTASSTTYQVMQYSYDSVGRLQCTAQRMNSSAWGSLPSDACTLQTTGSFGDDRITKRTFDNAGRLTKVQTGYGVTGVQADEVTTAYTDNGRVASVTDAEGNKTSYSYDGFDRLSKTSYPNTTKGAGTSSSTDYEELVYDAGSNVTSRRLRGYAGDSTKHIDFTYDALNRVTAKDLPGSEPDVAYTYDLLSELTGASQTGNALTFGYDALGRNTSQGGPQGTVSYQYDAAGRRTRLTWPDSFYVTYDYQVTGEVTTIKESGSTTLATYAYDDLGRRTSLTRGNGNVTGYGFDNVSRLASLGLNLDGGTTTNDVTTSFSYSPSSQIAAQTRTNDLYAWGGHYNVNRGYTSNGLNQLTAAGGTSLGYDARGNLTSSGSDSFSYSSENLLTGATVNSVSTTLSYDPMLRLYQTAAGATARLQYDGVNLIAEYNSSNVLQKRYVHGSGTDEPLVEYDGSGNRTYLLADERGSIVARSDNSGAKTAINSYDEYGIPANGNAGRFQYTGQTWLSDLGMYYYKARIYSPGLGRFIQADPIGYSAGMNIYNYLSADPVNGDDPSGMIKCTGSLVEHTSCGTIDPLACIGNCSAFDHPSDAANNEGGSGSYTGDTTDGVDTLEGGLPDDVMRGSLDGSAPIVVTGVRYSQNYMPISTSLQQIITNPTLDSEGYMFEAEVDVSPGFLSPEKKVRILGGATYFKIKTFSPNFVQTGGQNNPGLAIPIGEVLVNGRVFIVRTGLVTTTYFAMNPDVHWVTVRPTINTPPGTDVRIYSKR